MKGSAGSRLVVLGGGLPEKKRCFLKIIKNRNYSGMLIGRPIAILYFLARKITAEGAEERYKHLTVYFPSASLCALCG